MSTRQYKSAVVNCGTSGDNTIVPAVENKRIVVTSYTLVAASAVSVRWESGAAGTALTGIMPLATPFILTAPHNEAGHFATAVGALLNLELSGTVDVDGHITYFETD